MQRYSWLAQLANTTSPSSNAIGFDAAQELRHLLLHHDAEPGSKVIENQAHTFVAAFLTPPIRSLTLGPPESPSPLGTASTILADAGVTLDNVAKHASESKTVPTPPAYRFKSSDGLLLRSK